MLRDDLVHTTVHEQKPVSITLKELMFYKERRMTRMLSCLDFLYYLVDFVDKMGTRLTGLPEGESTITDLL